MPIDGLNLQEQDMCKIKAILFDMDDVFIEAKE